MMGETGPMGLHSKGRKTDMKTAAKRERKTLRIVELALLLGAAAFLMTGVWALNTQRDLADKVVRLHVLANSDTEEDQALKLLVRDAVLERATEILEQSADRAEAEIRLRESLPELEAIAEETVRANGYDYAVTAELEDTAFPTKEYDGFSLPAGEYLALRILIGEGVGQNWWCVVFPPLCTAASAGVPETALAAGLTEDQVSLMTEEDGGYQLKFKAVELWERLKAALERATEILEQSADRAEAEIRLRESLPELEAIAEETVRANGYDYAVTAELEDTAFPTKEYDGFSLPAGEYLALRILIGEGVGQNWWCVVFPPLCTAASAGVPETALAAGLTEDQVSLMTEEDGGYQLKFKAVELWERLKAALE